MADLSLPDNRAFALFQELGRLQGQVNDLRSACVDHFRDEHQIGAEVASIGAQVATLTTAVSDIGKQVGYLANMMAAAEVQRQEVKKQIEGLDTRLKIEEKANVDDAKFRWLATLTGAAMVAVIGSGFTLLASTFLTAHWPQIEEWIVASLR